MIRNNLRSRQEEAAMRYFVAALGDYAALVAIDSNSTSKSAEMRDIVEIIVPSWGLDYGEGSKSTDTFLQEFDDKVLGALRSGTIEVDRYSVCSDALSGLAQYSKDIEFEHGGEAYAMNILLRTGDLLIEVADYFGYNKEKDFAKDSAQELREAVKIMLENYAIPGNVVEGESNANYVIKQAVLYDNNVGFAFAHNPEAVSPFVTWRMFYNEDKNKLEFEWGNYFINEDKALVDYISRAEEYAKLEKTTEIPMPTAEIPQLKKLIQFIDSEYREQFKIPDGESIRITYPPEDGREPIEQPCKFINETHTQIGNSTYHICQFAETMERLGAKFEPVNQLQNVKLEPFRAGIGEEKFYEYNREDDNTCAGALSGDFGNGGERYYASWHEHNSDLYTPEIQLELQSVAYALRQNILKDRGSMISYCQENPDAMISQGKGMNDRDYQVYGFKLETDLRQYFVKCCTQDKNSRFVVFAYADKPTHMLEQNLKVYHADFNDPEIDERMEIIMAKDDADAISQANEICREAEEITLLALHEIDNNHDSREVNLTLPTTTQKHERNPRVNATEKEATAVKKDKSASQEKPEKPAKSKKHKRGEDR